MRATSNNDCETVPTVISKSNLLMGSAKNFDNDIRNFDFSRLSLHLLQSVFDLRHVVFGRAVLAVQKSDFGLNGPDLRHFGLCCRGGKPTLFDHLFQLFHGSVGSAQLIIGKEDQHDQDERAQRGGEQIQR